MDGSILLDDVPVSCARLGRELPHLQLTLYENGWDPSELDEILVKVLTSGDTEARRNRLLPVLGDLELVLFEYGGDSTPVHMLEDRLRADDRLSPSLVIQDPAFEREMKIRSLYREMRDAAQREDALVYQKSLDELQTLHDEEARRIEASFDRRSQLRPDDVASFEAALEALRRKHEDPPTDDSSFAESD